MKIKNRNWLVPGVLFFLGVLCYSHGAYAQLVLDGAYINMSGGTNANKVYIVVDQSSTSGISRLGSGGHIYTDGQYNFVQWNAGTTTGSYIFPFGYSNTDYLPFTFNKTSSGSSNVSASTWNTDNQNVPHPGVSDVAACWIMKGQGDSLTTALDRFWDVRTTAATTADLTYSYRGAENTISSPTTSLTMQRWTATPCSPWTAPAGPGNAGVISGIGSVGPVTGLTTFTPFVLVRTAAPLLQPVVANAGTDQTVNLGNSVTLGGSPSATGGVSPFSYSWSPSTFLASTTSANPVSTPTSNITYTLVVTDSRTCSANDAVMITVISAPAFGILKKKLDGGYYKLTSNVLYFKYEEEYRSGTLSYKVFDYKRQEVTASCSLATLLRKYGDNRFYLDFSSCSVLNTGEYYTLEVTSEKNEKYLLKFKY